MNHSGVVGGFEAFGKQNLSTFKTSKVNDKPVIETYLLGHEASGPDVHEKLLSHFMANGRRIEHKEDGQKVAS